MGEVSATKKFAEWYGTKPETGGERNLSLFSAIIPGVLAELRLFRETGAQQLRELFAVAGIGVLDLLSVVTEQDAAQRLRQLFGLPHKELEGSVPLALQLHSDEAAAAAIAREQRSDVQQILEAFVQAAVQEFLRLQASLVAVEERIVAKRQAVQKTISMQLHPDAQSDKGEFVHFTDRRLQQLREQKFLLQKQMAILSHALSQVASPLLEFTRGLASQLFVLPLDGKKAILVDPITQPA